MMNWIAVRSQSAMRRLSTTAGMSIGLLVILAANRMLFAKIAVAAPNPSSVQVVNLDGKWDFRFDKNGIGEQEGWFRAKSSGEWDSIQVPGSYNIQFPSKDAYTGKAWYRTSFRVRSRPGEHVFLHLEGVVLRSVLWVNGREAGASVLAFTPLDFDVRRSFAMESAKIRWLSR